MTDEEAAEVVRLAKETRDEELIEVVRDTLTSLEEVTERLKRFLED